MQDSILKKQFYVKFSLLIFIVFVFNTLLLAQTIMPKSGTILKTVVGGELFYDSGGATSNYSRKESGVITFNSTVGTVIRVVFTDFKVQQSWGCNKDALIAYDGNSTGSTQIGAYCGYDLPLVITSSGNSVTFSFSSDRRWTIDSGWVAEILVVDEDEAFCIPAVSNYQWGNNEYISNVLIGDINNNSGSDGYADYTDSQSTDVKIEVDYLLTITNGNYDNDTYSVWVDWNQDGDFDDAGEDIASESGGDVYTTTITPPTGVAVGAKIMRVRVNFWEIATACENTEWGEVEDYTLNVISNGAMPVAECKVQTIQLDASGNASITPANINNGSSDVETSSVNLILSLDKSTFDCSDIGANDVVLSVEDEDGNVSTCTSVVTVEDNFDPVSQCKSATIKLDASGSANITTADIDNGSTDNCSIASFVLDQTDFTTEGDKTVKLTVTDASGNSSSCNANLTVLPADPVVTLSISSNGINENGGTINITVSLNTAQTTPVSVNLSYSGASVADYTSASQIVIPANSTFASIIFKPVDNDINDGDRDVVINITSVVNAVENGIQQQTITIVDDDAPSTASIEINTQDASVGTTADDLVQNILVTGCLIADNVTFSGNSNQIGYFNQGDSDFPLAEGIILSTGNVADAVGPNNSAHTSTDFNGVSGDSDLDVITTGYTEDAAVLEFDFVPAGDILQFRYVFASEEFLEFACGSYNDVFGFFLSGPGIGDGTTSSAENIALLPNSTTAVAINNVHGQGVLYNNNGYNNLQYSNTKVYDSNGAYSDWNWRRYYYEYNVVSNSSCAPVNEAYYVDNGQFADKIYYEGGRIKSKYIGNGGYAIEYDGRTVILTATYNVEMCKTYHIKLAVGDVGDGSWDSSVFLEAKSFKSNEVQVDNMIGTIEGNQDIMYEGCEGSFMRFIRNEDYDINEEVDFAINIAGTANNEAGISQDYVYTNAGGTVIGDGVFPTTITIPSGDEYVDYHYKALDEGAVENDETIIFRIDRCPCDGSEYYEKTVTIISAPKVDAVASAAIQCVGAGNPTATISVQLIDGISSANYLYSFDGGLTFGNDNVRVVTSALSDGSDLVGQTFNIVVKDLFSCSANIVNLTTTIPAIQSIDANAGGNKSICYGLGTQLLGSGGIFYEWTCSTPGIINYLSDPNVSNPWVADDIPVGTYVFTLKVQDQSGALPICSDQENMTLTIKRTPVINSVTAGKYELCSEEGTTLQANVDMTVSYLWNPASGLSEAAIANPAFSAVVGGEESRSFTLTVKASNECSAVANLDNAITVYPNPSISLLPTSNLCSDGSNGEIHIKVSGGTPADAEPKYSYSWSPSVGSNSPNATGLSLGSYSIVVTDSKSCTETGNYTIGSEPVPSGIYHE